MRLLHFKKVARRGGFAVMTPAISPERLSSSVLGYATAPGASPSSKMKTTTTTTTPTNTHPQAPRGAAQCDRVDFGAASRLERR